MYQQNESFESKVKFRQAKGFLKLPNLHLQIELQSPSLPRNFALVAFGELPIVFSTKVNLLYLLNSVAWRCCLLHLIKQNCLLNTFKNSNLDDSDIFLPVFPSRTNLRLLIISVTPKIVE